MKKLFILTIIILITLLIYVSFIDNKIYYLTLGDSYETLNNNLIEKSNYDFINNDYRTIDVINDINNNFKKDVTIQNAIIKADIITLSIGKNDINAKLMYTEYLIYDHINQVIEDIDNLLNLLNSKTKEEVIIIGYKNFIVDNILYVNYANKRLEEIVKKYNFHFVENKDELISYIEKNNLM